MYLPTYTQLVYLVFTLFCDAAVFTPWATLYVYIISYYISTHALPILHEVEKVNKKNIKPADNIISVGS